MLPIALFWSGWSTRPDVHWIGPIIEQGTALVGSVLIYVPCNFYMLDVYRSKYGHRLVRLRRCRDILSRRLFHFSLLRCMKLLEWDGLRAFWDMRR